MGTKEHGDGANVPCGVDIAINSEDILIFDSDVSKKYMRLYNADTLTAEELEDIRIDGLIRL